MQVFSEKKLSGYPTVKLKSQLLILTELGPAQRAVNLNSYQEHAL